MSAAHLDALPVCASRALAEFPPAERMLRALDEAVTRAAGRPLRYHVHAGFVRAALTGGAYSDVDVAAATAEDLRTLRAVARLPLEVQDAAGRCRLGRLGVRRRPVAAPPAPPPRVGPAR